MLQFQQVVWRGRQRLGLQNCCLGLSRSRAKSGSVTCLVSDHPGGRGSHFQRDNAVGGGLRRAVVTGTQVWRQGLETISVQGTNRGKWVWEENSLLPLALPNTLKAMPHKMS